MSTRRQINHYSLLINHYFKGSVSFCTSLLMASTLLALSLDVLVDIVAHGIEVVEEIGNGQLYHVRLAVRSCQQTG